MTIEELIDLQEPGAPVLDLAGHENPYPSEYNVPKGNSEARSDWLARHGPWKFGGEAENASEGDPTHYVSKLLGAPVRRDAT